MTNIYNRSNTWGVSSEHVKHSHCGKYKSDAFHPPGPEAGEQTSSWPSNARECYCFSFWVMEGKQSTCCVASDSHGLRSVAMAESDTPVLLSLRAEMDRAHLLCFLQLPALSRCFSQPFVPLPPTDGFFPTCIVKDWENDALAPCPGSSETGFRLYKH